jgi:hypothetical protein
VVSQCSKSAGPNFVPMFVSTRIMSRARNLGAADLARIQAAIQVPKSLEKSLRLHAIEIVAHYNLYASPGNTKGRNITVLLSIDLLFDWYGLVCFEIKNKNGQLSCS